jgi:hypothetical protein
LDTIFPDSGRKVIAMKSRGQPNESAFMKTDLIDTGAIATPALA